MAAAPVPIVVYCQPMVPPAWLLDKATLIWRGDYFAELAEEMGNDIADECALSFAYGFEKGLFMAMLRPEWTQGLYLKLREH